MSAFLGPIHYWLFNKIKLQDELTKFLLAQFPMGAQLRTVLDEQYGRLPEGELEDLVDTSNIHGWLQNQVSTVQTRLAQAVARLLAQDENALSKIEQAAFAFGEQNPLGDASSPQKAFQSLNDMFLDGMPCDRVNQLIKQEDTLVTWERTRNLHSIFWQQAGCEDSLYDRVRGAWLNGMLSKTHLTYRQDVNRFTLAVREK